MIGGDAATPLRTKDTKVNGGPDSGILLCPGPVVHRLDQPVIAAHQHPYVHTSGSIGGGFTEREAGRQRTNRFLIENVDIKAIESIEPVEANEPAENSIGSAFCSIRWRGASIEKIVRLTYDFAVAFDDDTRDDTSYKIVMPMDVTIHGEAVHGPREGDGCRGWWSNYRLPEVSYGPLQLITLQAG